MTDIEQRIVQMMEDNQRVLDRHRGAITLDPIVVEAEFRIRTLKEVLNNIRRMPPPPTPPQELHCHD